MLRNVLTVLAFTLLFLAQAPGPKCVRVDGSRVCGSDCKAQDAMTACSEGCVEGGGTVACALTPGGTGDASQAGGPVCFGSPVTGGSKRCLSVLGAR
jgi:hypothetical protein